MIAINENDIVQQTQMVSSAAFASSSFCNQAGIHTRFEDSIYDEERTTISNYTVHSVSFEIRA